MCFLLFFAVYQHLTLLVWCRHLLRSLSLKLQLKLVTVCFRVIKWGSVHFHPADIVADLLADVNISQDSRNVSTRERELRFEVGKLKGRLEVRVRVNPVGRPGSHWSDWSPTTSWEDLKDEKSEFINQNTIFILIPLLQVYFYSF